jgi:hypothetical protein
MGIGLNRLAEVLFGLVNGAPGEVNASEQAVNLGRPRIKQHSLPQAEFGLVLLWLGNAPY